MHQLFTRRVAAATVLALALFAGACKDSATGDDDDEPEIATMRLTVGTSSVNVTSNGTASGTLTLPRGGSATLTTQWLKADGTPDLKVSPATFRVDVQAAAGVSGVTFTNATDNRLNGTFTTTATATGGRVRFGLFHVAESHTDFGPFEVQVAIAP